MDIVLLIATIAAGAAAVAALIYANRRRPDDIWDWAEEAYQPRSGPPRAVTRIKSQDIEWEIKA